jgi:RND superfamily putative drug exporter
MAEAIEPQALRRHRSDQDATRRRRTYRRWVFVVVVGLVAVIPLFGRLSNGSVAAGTPSANVQTLLDRYGPNSGEDFVVLEGPVDRPGLAGEVHRAVARMEHTQGVATVQSCFDAAGNCLSSSPLRAKGGDASLIVVTFARAASGSPSTSTLDAVQSAGHRITDARVLVGGNDYFGLAATSLAESDLLRGELLGLAAALVVLTALFGFRGAMIPLLAGFATFAGAFVLLLPLTALTAVDAYGVNIVTMLGLGLSLDYGLLLLARYRQARAGGRSHAEALAESKNRAGRTVTWSGLTVIACLATLLVFGDTPFTSIALGGICATLTAIAVSRTLVPALLGSWGQRLRPLRRSTAEHGFARLADGVRRRPWTTAGLSLFALLMVAAPAFGTHLSELGTDSLPSTSQPRQALAVLDAHFGLGTAAVDVVAPLEPASASAHSLARTIERVPGVKSVTTSRLGYQTLLVANVTGDGNGPGAVHVVEELRALQLPYHLLVGGEAAFQLDHEHALGRRLPLALLLLAAVTVVLIGLLTRSLALALLAPLLAALSEAAMLGALVWGYQHGHLQGVLPITSTGSLVVYVPIVAVAIAYALSLDYLVFVLARVQEARRDGRSLDEAMKEGLSRTGPVITTAAGLMTLVFAGFATGSLLLVQQLGFALAAAIVLDATLVRCLLLPAVVSLLARLHPRGQRGAPTPLEATKIGRSPSMSCSSAPSAVGVQP